jgi:hypothetical protein
MPRSSASTTRPWLAPLADDLSEWREASVPASNLTLVSPRPDGEPWRDDDYRNWRKRGCNAAAEAVGLASTRPRNAASAAGPGTAGPAHPRAPRSAFAIAGGSPQPRTESSNQGLRETRPGSPDGWRIAWLPVGSFSWPRSAGSAASPASRLPVVGGRYRRRWVRVKSAQWLPRRQTHPVPSPISAAEPAVAAARNSTRRRSSLKRALDLRTRPRRWPGRAG